MSCQSYIDDHLMADIDGCRLTAAAIIGYDGSVWAQSSNFHQLKAEEVTGIYNIINDFDNPGTLAPTGLHLGGLNTWSFKPGATVKKTGMALIIGIYEDPMTAGQCNMVVERIGDHLIRQGL